jgi:hypothetical protein
VAFSGTRLLKHSDLIDSTNCSATEFRSGLRAGRRRHFTAAAASTPRNSSVNSGIVAANAATGAEPDQGCMSMIESLIAGADPRVAEERDARGAAGGAAVVARHAGLAIGPRLDEVAAAVAGRRDRKRARRELAS